ncbi:uncharacterized protein BX663DRAFT_487766 [Cokeromyces recurvatus]|uniref:uncharacterized protein n=1 Tax=Cokeromyces recurvatus TaxID=90255 RepID=UPI0022208308|nr:uncharacterized protein BX663DRAFT_487766 [Cokeromyces recurvatus]KAI7901185.1 hypothetical protein BX663DRAFT_487766 [Cokeromyces recurvatus]
MSRSKETIQSVIVGSSIAALAGATTGATAAVLKNAPVKQWTLSTGLNCGIFGATFFLDSETKDFDALFSSTMAGATTGGLLSAAYRGPKTVVSGAVMFGAICSVLQVIYTAGNHWRQESILKGAGFNDRLRTSKEEIKEEAYSFLNHIHMPSWFPIHRLSEQEYNELLDTRLHTLEAELAELERKLQRENKNK